MGFAPLSLKARLGLGAAALGTVAALAALLVIVGMSRVASRIDAALEAEARIDGYAVLSTQISRFLVVSTEAVQSDLPVIDRSQRVQRLSEDIVASFARIRTDLEASVASVQRLGMDAQSRRATTSLAVARMEAHFNATRAVLLSPERGRENLQGHIDTFAIGFDPNLNQAITDEMRVRDAILGGIDDLKRRLSAWALALGGAGMVLGGGAYLGVIRPQLRRLDLLHQAARKITQEDFAVRLPETHTDEIGRLFSQTNAMVAALASRKAEVDAEWTRLTDTIDARTDDLRRANKELARKDQDRRRFFADISHELRTPLTVILLEAQLGQAAPDPDSAGAFRTIHTRADRLKRRIDDLLRIARSDSGQLELNAAPFDLGEMVAEAVAETRAETHSAGMVLSGDPVPPARCQGDVNWQRQVLAGLIRNAIRHARDGGTIAITTTLDARLARVAVTDNGPGIPPSLQDAVFQRFAQGPGGTGADGFGLGLALAKWVVEAQGGTITITSPTTDSTADHPGTTVTLGIPLVAAEG